MRRSTHESGITLAEVLIAMSGSVIVIGALMVSSIGLQQSFHASESYANSQADERRLIDYVARDLRRAIGISVCGADGVPGKLSSGSMNLETQTLVVTLPAYYKSHTTTDSAYDEALSVIAAGDRVAYGTSAGPAPEFTVSFRKIFVASEKSICFVREEGNARQVIVRGAEKLQLEVTVASDGEACALVARFFSPYARQQSVVAVHDQVMLRNARID